MMSGPTGCSVYSKLVATPKLPPPPRSPQNRSLCSRSDARSDLAVGGDEIDRRDVVAGPAEAARQVAETAAERQPRAAGGRDEPEHGREPVQLRLAVDVAEQAAGLRARHAFAPGSTHTPRISDMSSISPPSQTARPAMLWPPPLIDSGRPCSRAALTPAMTSATPRQRTMSAGRRSIIAFQTDARLVESGSVREAGAAPRTRPFRSLATASGCRSTCSSVVMANYSCIARCVQVIAGLLVRSRATNPGRARVM